MYLLTSKGIAELDRLDEKSSLGIIDRTDDVSWLRWLILTYVTDGDESVEEYSDIFPYLAARGFRSPAAASLGRSVFLDLSQRGFIERQ